MTDKTVGPTRPGAIAFVLLTVALSLSIWIGTWLATGRPNTFHGPGVMMAATYAGVVRTERGCGHSVCDFAPGLPQGVAARFIRFRCGWRAYAAALLPFPLALLLLTIALG